MSGRARPRPDRSAPAVSLLEPAQPSEPAPPAGRSGGRRHVRRHRAVRTREVPQMEDADCGPACLSMVLTTYGRRVRLAEVRQRCGVGRDGLTAAGLGRAAASYGLDAKARWVVPANLTSVASVPVPAVALLRPAHYAVLEGVRGRRVWLNDPAVGRFGLTADEFAERSSGLFITAKPTPAFRRGGPRLAFVRAVAGRVRPYLPIILAAAVLGILASLPALVASLSMRALLNRVLVAGDHAWRPALLGVLAGGAVLAVLIGWAQQRIIARCLALMGTRYTAGYLSTLLRLPADFFHRRSVSGLVSRVQMNDGLASLLSERMTAPIAAGVTIVANAAVLARVAPPLLGVVAVAALIQIVLLRAVYRVAGPHQQRLLFEQLRRDTVAFGGLRTIEAVKADGAERWLFRSWLRSAVHAIQANNELGAATLGVLAVSAAVAPAALTAITIVGGLLTVAGRLDIGSLLTAQLVAGALLGPLYALVGLATDIQLAKVHLSVLDDAMATAPDPARAAILTDRSRPVAPQRLAGSLDFQAVSFGYDPNRPPLIHDLDFRAEPGQWVALVGASGSGKSTVARLLVGAAEPWSGRVLLDGQPRSAFPRETLAASIGYVEQTLRLFEGSLRDNLTLWDASIDDDELYAALRESRIDRLVTQRGGLDGAQVHEHARNLSGGEQQRLELARALVGRPSLLVLDEATSALDSATESDVLNSLRRTGATCLFIAHRISTVREADLILVMEHGQVVQRGVHIELAARPGPYRRLVTGGAR